MLDVDAVDPLDSEFRCSALSRELDEPLAGTAVSADIWLLLEYNGPWAARATEDNDLPPPAQAWLDGQMAALPSARLQFIKQAPTIDRPGLAFFVAVTDERAPALYRFDLDRYEDLLALDLAALLAGDMSHLADDGRLILVCTNGRRDLCCAQWGVMAYGALAGHHEAEEAVWQTTHVGGHRFAPNLVTFPEGAYYGRLAVDETEAFLADQAAGLITLAHYRGRSSHDAVTQAADYFLRREAGERALDAFAYLDMSEGKDGHWQVRFRGQDGARHLVELAVAPEPRRLYASCGSDKIKEVSQYRFVRYSVTGNR